MAKCEACFPEITPEEMPKFLNDVAEKFKDEEGQETMLKLAQCSYYIHLNCWKNDRGKAIKEEEKNMTTGTATEALIMYAYDRGFRFGYLAAKLGINWSEIPEEERKPYEDEAREALKQWNENCEKGR